jgi:cyanophycin synthetase
LVGFYRADPPQVTGDGMHTIEELVIEKNSNKNERLSDIVINDDVLSYIGRKGYTPNTILAQGNTIDLTAKTGRMYGGYTREMLPEVHPKMHDIFERASTVIPAPILGFDLIIPDPTSDPDTQKWGHHRM